MSNKNELGVDEVDIEILHELLSDQTQKPQTDLPEGKRQILLVSGHHLFTASWLETAASAKTQSSSVLLLTGTNSPSSDPELKKAYVTVVEDGKTVRRPKYDKSRGAIYMEVHQRQLENILAQVHEPSVYCWIGHFKEGNIYADIHTSHP